MQTASFCARLCPADTSKECGNLYRSLLTSLLSHHDSGPGATHLWHWHCLVVAGIAHWAVVHSYLQEICNQLSMTRSEGHPHTCARCQSVSWSDSLSVHRYLVSPIKYGRRAAHPLEIRQDDAISCQFRGLFRRGATILIWVWLSNRPLSLCFSGMWSQEEKRCREMRKLRRIFFR